MYHFSLTFLHIVFSNVSSYYLPERMHSYTGCICLPFLRCVFSNVSSKRLHERMQSHIVAFVWLFSTVRFQMCLQIAFPRGCIRILVGFVWLFSTVRFQMCSHEGDLRWHLKNHNRKSQTNATNVTCIFSWRRFEETFETLPEAQRTQKLSP